LKQLTKAVGIYILVTSFQIRRRECKLLSTQFRPHCPLH